ncbi:MAG: PP2C family protein-serine/threonine phosphatase [Acidimicrobiales bacterium]
MAVLVAGLVLTAVLTWAASRANSHSAMSLLKLQVREAAATVGTALPSLQSKLEDALSVATATHSPATFRKFAAGHIGAGGFSSESLWQHTASGTKMLAFVGALPALLRDGDASSFFSGLHQSTRLQVTGLLPGSPRHLGYAVLGAGGDGYVVYAESALGPRRAPAVSASSPFGDLGYALYLGTRVLPSELIESSVPTPLGGTTAKATVPFGNSAITVLATPTRPLTAGLSTWLAWIVLGCGVALSLSSAGAAEYLGRRRKVAENLNDQLSELYSKQRSIALTLQEALLPEHLPSIPGMEIAARYIPGVRDLDVGGDWYDVVVLDDDRFVFVVGDVSGRGVRAAAVMASLRFAGRAFALEGHPPQVILEHLEKTVDISSDGHFATVLCGLVDVPNHELVLASAGHLPPVLCSGGQAVALESAPMPPIGVTEGAAIEPRVVKVPPGSTLVAYTDGLVERRGELLDDSIARLERSLIKSAPSLDGLLSGVLKDLTLDAPEDDVALIGLRWLS